MTYFFEEDVLPTIYGMDQKVPVRIYDGELEIDFAEILDGMEGGVADV